MSIKPHPTIENARIVRWRDNGRKGKQHYLTLYDCDKARAILWPTRQKSGLIAPNPKTGKSYGNMKNLFKTASERSGVHIKGPHTLRHICGTYTLAATGDLRLVQDTLGHTQVLTTELYTQINLDRLRSAQAKTASHMVNHTP